MQQLLRGFAALSVAFAGLAGTALAHPHEKVFIPFVCAIERGRVELTPAAQQSYDILDRRIQQQFTACFGPDPAQCRTWMLHRFTLACGAAPVPWIDVVAAAAPHARLKVSADRGQLVFAPRRDPAAARAHDCFDALTEQQAHRGALIEECWRRTAQSAGPEIRLPAGFAPAGLIGARFLLPAGPLERASAAADDGSPDAGASGALPLTRVAADPPPRPEAAKSAKAASVLAPPNSWITELIAEGELDGSLADVRAGASASLANRIYQLIGAAATLATLGVLLWRRFGWGPPLLRTPLWPGLRRDTSGPACAETDEAAMVEALLSGGLRGIGEMETRLGLLSGAMPLRQVLKRELRSAEKRLCALIRERPADAGQWRRLKGRAQAAAREINRLQEIADGAHRSLTDAASAVAPRDRAEAYHVLGVSADVDAKILKKLVDALRQSWHPDLARDDTDRCRREERIKQINVAWDLISGKRVEV